jgi:DNA-binding response OmpR family regulator
VVCASDGVHALEIVRQERPDLVLLDVMLPDLNGFDICRILRKETTVPIIILSAKTEEIDKVSGLGLGADDYITKPFSMRELLARISAMLRRVTTVKRQILTGDDLSPLIIDVDNLRIDIVRHEVKRNEYKIGLSPKEFALMEFLVKNRGRVFSRDQIVNNVWGYNYKGGARTVDTHMVSLRKKIETDVENPQYIKTVRGIGYKFVD